MRRLYSFLRWCPGLTGLYLRQKFYPRLFARCGRRVLFGRFVDFRFPRRICIGDHAVIHDNVFLDAGRARTSAPVITIADHVFVGAGTGLHAGSGGISIGSGSSLGSFCAIIGGAAMVEIGADVLLAAYCRVGPAAEEEGVSEEQAGSRGPTVIGPGGWLGVRSHVLPGARIGEGSVVGAHARVCADLPDYVVAVGRPARVIRHRRSHKG